MMLRISRPIDEPGIDGKLNQLESELLSVTKVSFQQEVEIADIACDAIQLQRDQRRPGSLHVLNRRLKSLPLERLARVVILIDGDQVHALQSTVVFY
jgi:hypothetical protein